MTYTKSGGRLAALKLKSESSVATILKNWPAGDARDSHVAAARGLLHRGGHDAATLVALVPVTFDAGDGETLETLGPDTFATARVTTKIIRFRA